MQSLFVSILGERSELREKKRSVPWAASKRLMMMMLMMMLMMMRMMRMMMMMMIMMMMMLPFYQLYTCI